MAPFLGHLSDEGSFWQFNRAAGWSFGFAFVVALILFLGLVSAFTTIETLFGGSVPWPYFDIWILCFILFWPWLAISGLPRAFAVPGADDCPRPVAFVVRSILVPLVLIYLAILYAYMAMILVRWDLPQGQAAYLVSAYGTLGVATHLIACTAPGFLDTSLSCGGPD